MSRQDAAELIASKLDRIPLPDGREYRFLAYSTFGQAEDTKARIGKLAQEVGEGIVHLLESNNFVISHPSDPVEELPTGKRIARLICPQCSESIAAFPLDEKDYLTPNLQALQNLSLIGRHPCLSNHH